MADSQRNYGVGSDGPHYEIIENVRGESSRTPLDWEQVVADGHATYSREDLSPESLPLFIHLIWRDLSWEDIYVPEQGMDHAVILLDGVASDEGEFAAMVPRRVVVRAQYTEAYRVQASRESGVVAALGSRSTARLPQSVRQAHVPRRFTGNQRSIRVTLLSVIDGEPLDAAVWKSMTDEQREEVIDQLGSLLGAMHTMNSALPPVSNLESWWLDDEDADGGDEPSGGASSSDAPKLNYTERTLPGKHELMREYMPTILKPNVSAEEYARAEKIMELMDGVLARPDLRRCLTHGDLYPEHLLWQADGGVGVIDFSDMTVGDPAWDYAHFADISPELAERVYAQAKVSAEDVADPQVVFADPDLLERAKLYKQWDNLFMLIHHYRTGIAPRGEI